MRATASLSMSLLAATALAGCVPFMPRPEASPPEATHRSPTEFEKAAAAGWLRPVAYQVPSTVSGTEPPLLEDGYDDLWHRIRDGFGLPRSEHPNVEAELERYSRQASHLEQVLGRAERYLHFVVEELEQRGMPTELALLPVIESSYHPLAYSSGRAAGLWQFIPSTGAHFGLKQNWWYDGRRDVYASTHAALDYLRQLHARFESDWLLALAAYNAGQGTVGRAIDRNRRAGRPTDFWNLALPAETRRYVPKLLALSALVDDPEKHGVKLPTIPDEPYLTAVDTDGQIELALAAELAELSLEELQLLNPGFKHWATDPEGPHRLLLPVAHADRFHEQVAALPAEQRVRWQRHRVRSGETLSGIALRYGTSVAVLRQSNRLRGDLIRVGQHLLIPLQGGAQALARTDEPPATPRKQIHTVRSGDSLWTIARRHGITVDELAKWNGLDAQAVLRPGQPLTVYRTDAARATEAVTVDPERPEAIRYVVRPGDSLWSIAKRFKVSVADLRHWNTIPNGSLLQPGQLLTLLVDGAQAGSN
jgi:membrane-bound lytic murein transglycosylase D